MSERPPSDGQRARPPIHVLSPADLAIFRQYRETLAQHQLVVGMLQRALRDFWREVQERYGLPHRFDVDAATGALYETEQPVESENPLPLSEPARG